MKKSYSQPKTLTIPVHNESLMLTASPGASGKYDEKEPIDSKENNLTYDEEEEDDGFDLGINDNTDIENQELWAWK